MLSPPVAKTESQATERGRRVDPAPRRSPASSSLLGARWGAPAGLSPSRAGPSPGRCQCGGVPGPTGECAACRARRLQGAKQQSSHARSYQDGGPKDAGTPAPDAGTPAPAGLSSPTVTGSVKDIVMDVSVSFTTCSDCNDGLEAIQVAWATGPPAKAPKVGKQTMMFPPFAAVFETFVDGGKDSPGGLTYTGDHPYYIGRKDLPASYGWSKRGPFGSVSGCTANPQDMPTAALAYDQVFFETAIVCLKHKGGSDKLLNSFSWGFVKKGKVLQADIWSGGQTAPINQHSTPTVHFLSVLKGDYPNYSFTV
jgi:hypothetical protein